MIVFHILISILLIYSGYQMIEFAETAFLKRIGLFIVTIGVSRIIFLLLRSRL